MTIKIIFLAVFLLSIASCSMTKTSSIRDFELNKNNMGLEKIEATFKFSSLSKDNQEHSGLFTMTGMFDKKSHRAFLKAKSWIKTAKNYNMVNLIGIFDENFEVFGGSIEHEGCKEFSLKKIEKFPGKNINGVWRGLYTCAQGLTELTLTIK